MPRKNKKQDDLDTTTTFADMNIEGFKWYDPSQKKKDDGGNKVRQKISRREYWRMVRDAFAAFLPWLAIFLIGMGIVIALAYLWLG